MHDSAHSLVAMPSNHAPEEHHMSAVMSPYAFAQAVTKIIKEAGHEKEIRPQMMYNYRKNNLLKKPLTDEYAAEWAARYIARNLSK
jgi:hypothetical protein